MSDDSELTRGVSTQAQDGSDARRAEVCRDETAVAEKNRPVGMRDDNLADPMRRGLGHYCRCAAMTVVVGDRLRVIRRGLRVGNLEKVASLIRDYLRWIGNPLRQRQGRDIQIIRVMNRESTHEWNRDHGQDDARRNQPAKCQRAEPSQKLCQKPNHTRKKAQRECPCQGRRQAVRETSHGFSRTKYVFAAFLSFVSMNRRSCLGKVSMM